MWVGSVLLGLIVGAIDRACERARNREREGSREQGRDTRRAHFFDEFQDPPVCVYCDRERTSVNGGELCPMTGAKRGG